MTTIAEANKTVHPVETQWHYEAMVEYGFEPVTKEGIGLVRSYEYRHPNGTVIICTTGYSSDRWEDKANGAWGYWRALKPHLEKVTSCNS